MRAEGGVPPLGPRGPHHKWGGGVSSPSSLCLAPGDPSWAVPGAHVGTRMHMGAGVRVHAGAGRRQSRRDGRRRSQPGVHHGYADEESGRSHAEHHAALSRNEGPTGGTAEPRGLGAGRPPWPESRAGSSMRQRAKKRPGLGRGAGGNGRREQGHFGRPGKCPESILVLVAHLPLTKER